MELAPTPHDGTVSATSVTAADTMGNEAEETSKCRRQSKEQQTKPGR